MRKMPFVFFNENMLVKILGFDHMHENKTFVFVFLKREINLKVLKFFEFFLKYFGYFNTSFVSYSVKYNTISSKIGRKPCKKITKFWKDFSFFCCFNQ